MELENLGKTVEVTVGGEAATLKAGNLAQIVGRTASAEPATWQLEQIHFHWGRHLGEGSEHYKQGRQYPLEAHLVHFNTAYGTSVSTAVAGRGDNKDAVLVVGVFFEIASSNVPMVETIAANIPDFEGTVALTDLSPSDLFDGTGDFYSYRGSLTTPGCTEVVTWVVLQQPRPIREETMRKFLNTKKTAEGELSSKYGVYRPLQPINGRTIYSSSGATHGCTNPKDPVFPCGDTRPLRGAAKHL